MTGSFTVGLVQMTSGRDLGPNIEAASSLIREARAAGADFVLTPETTTMMEPRRRLTLEKAMPEAEHAGVSAFAALAAELEIWLLIGSMTVGLGDAGEDDKVANRSFLFDPAGRIAARYDKIHMFDVEIPDGQSYRESSTYRPGSAAVTAALPWGTLGLSVCYDLRFPHLYRSLAQAGAEFLTVPAAFTQFTGQGPLARPAARPGHRDRLLRLRPGAMRRACRGAADLRPFPGGRALGRGPGRRRRGPRRGHRRGRPGQDRPGPAHGAVAGPRPPLRGPVRRGPPPRSGGVGRRAGAPRSDCA